MNHPFTQIFRRALSKSSRDNNLVLEEARGILKKGYKPEEIYPVLKRIRNGLIKDSEIETLDEVLEELDQYIDE